MRIVNEHRRFIGGCPDAVGLLLDSLGGSDDRLWPTQWPPMRLSDGVSEGSSGGHAFIRYRVLRHLPGRLVRFGFQAPSGLRGWHQFEVEPRDGGCFLSHKLVARTAGCFTVAWCLAIGPMHDAVIEDAFDRAEQALGITPTGPRWTLRVRILRRLFSQRRRFARLTSRGSSVAGTSQVQGTRPE